MTARRTNRNQGATKAPADIRATHGMAPIQLEAANAAPGIPSLPVIQAVAPGATEPDNEPRPAMAGVAGETNEDGGEKETGRIDLRNVKMEPFSGLISPGAYDSGVRDWWKQFADQLEDA
ncbi:hypothetical protein GN244_ATG13928 [Phytophthora infestans]|nr:hypothetical protein GN244_ATG13928 [Phytophthora infestans]KAF4137034.1 hypothetical protein GN958_ATG13755 [Phytophthora infestans]KAF4142839.1 hypothetical protein GN958_ATG07976 [Phytophthora infestans]